MVGDTFDDPLDDRGGGTPAGGFGPAGAGRAGRFCQVVTTTDSREAAVALARSVVTARLGACAQVGGPITSVYWWDGEVRTAEEWQCLVKTTEDAYPALEAHIRDHHPYEVPEIVRTPVTAGLPAYLAWVAAETRADDPDG